MRAIILADLADQSGGAQKVAAQSAQALAAEGVETILVISTGHGDEQRDGVRVIGLGLSDIWDLPLHKGAMAGVWNREAGRALALKLETLREADTIVHLHQWTRGFSPSVFGALTRSQLPFAVTLHDYSLFCPNGVYYRFDQQSPCALAPLSLPCLAAPCDPRSALHKIVRVARTYRTRSAIARGDFDVVHVSTLGAKTALGKLPVGVREHVIANPVSVSPVAAARISSDACFAYIGRLTVEKGAVMAAQAAQAAKAPICFIGEGPARSEILAACPQARMLGHISPEVLNGMLAGEIRAVLAPSLWPETGPLTVYEAQASGVPVIASARSGSADCIVPGETGLVVEPDAGSFANAMTALAHTAFARRMGAEAHARYWADPPTPQAHARKLASLYGDMLVRHGV